jgi:hypothetical protein
VTVYVAPATPGADGFRGAAEPAITGADNLRLTRVIDKLTLSVWITDLGPRTWTCTR